MCLFRVEICLQCRNVPGSWPFWLAGSKGGMLPSPLLPGKAHLCTWGQAGEGLGPPDLWQIPKPIPLASQTTGAGNTPDPRTAPGPPSLLPCSWLVSSLQELLVNQNPHQDMQVTGDFSQSLSAWPSILRLRLFFSPAKFIFVQRLPQGSSFSN